MAKATKLQHKIKAGQRARKGKACPLCNRRMKVNATTCQFHKKYEE